MKNLFTLFTLVCLVLGAVSGQKCGCKRGECCSKFGFCGNDDAHCGTNCWAGPCKRRNKVKVGDIVSDGFFNGIVASQRPRGCPGKGFYSRARFLLAMASYPTFGTIGSVDDSKREIAAFFAHVAHETGSLCFIEENGGQSKPYCDQTYSKWPCAANKHYYGRGPLKLTWNYNYGAAGRAIGFNVLKNPELVATNALISIKASIWFWMENCHGTFISGKGFGATIRAINSAECDGKRTAQVSSRVKYYEDYCKLFQVNPGPNLRC
ncbi:chitinase [Salvia divinorum]|uniref:Chitinase n=1 Tax=Salvia divinorum TaxID=28513 RepID=A0ABD1GL47_SALDI